jgi:hypothetical protein
VGNTGNSCPLIARTNSQPDPDTDNRRGMDLLEKTVRPFLMMFLISAFMCDNVPAHGFGLDENITDIEYVNRAPVIGKIDFPGITNQKLLNKLMKMFPSSDSPTFFKFNYNPTRAFRLSYLNHYMSKAQNYYELIRIILDRWSQSSEKGKLDRYGYEVPDKIYGVKEFDRQIVIDDRTKLVAKKVSERNILLGLLQLRDPVRNLNRSPKNQRINQRI